MATLVLWLLVVVFLGVFAAQVAARVRLIAAAPNTFALDRLGFRIQRVLLDVVLQRTTIAERPVAGAAHARGFWGFLAYAQNGHINNGRKDIGSRNVQDITGTLLYADTDGWDACLYPDGGGNVCYRHSGGNEKSSETDRGIAGQKRPKGRAVAVFVDTHVELIKKAPKRIFTLERE